jgi:excisionase family DNA binding protein
MSEQISIKQATEIMRRKEIIEMPITRETPETYTVKEVAAILKISLRIAYELFKSKGFPATRIGSVHRVSKTAFHRWLENGSRIKLNA